MAYIFCKRFVSAVLSLIMVCSFLPFTALGAKQNIDEEDIYVSLDFDAVATNAIPYGISLNRMEAVTVQPDAEKHDKAALLRKEGTLATADIPTNVSAMSMTFSFEFMAEDFPVRRSVGITDTESVFSEAFSVTAEGRMVLSDGRKLFTLKPGRWYRFDLVYRFGEKRFDVYADGKCVASNVYMPNHASFGECRRLRFQADGGGFGSRFFLDSIRIVRGDRIYPDSCFEKSPYNPDVKEEREFFTPSDTESVFLNTDFDSDTVGSDPSAASATLAKSDLNKITVDPFPSDENKSLMLYRTVNSNPHVDFNVSVSAAAKVMFEMDYYIWDKPAYATFGVTFRDNLSGFNNVLRIGSTGWLTVGSKSIAQYPTETWHHVTMVINYNEMRYDAVYIDGELVAENVPFALQTAIEPALIRFDINNGSSEALINLDNIRLYAGDKIKTAEELISGSADLLAGAHLITPETAVEKYLSGTVALSSYSSFARGKDGTRTDNIRSEFINGTAYIPVAYIARELGGSALWNPEDSSVTVTADGKTVRYTNLSSTVQTPSGEYTMGEDAIIKDGTFLIPGYELAQTLTDVQVHSVEKYGIITVDTEKKSLDDAKLKDIYDYITYTRPSKEQILEDFGAMKGVHPRILATREDFERIRAYAETDRYMKEWATAVIADADEIITQEPTAYKLTSAENTLLEAARQHISRCEYLGMAYQLTGDKRYSDFLWRELESVCTFKDWYAQTHFLDTAEMAAGAAIGYDWCYDVWTPEQRKVIEEGIMNLALKPARECYDFHGGGGMVWVNAESNWNLVCNGGIGTAALALLDVYPDFCAELLADGMISMENAIGAFAPDGVWMEGPSYMDYALTYLVMQMAAMKTTLGTDYGYLYTNNIHNSSFYAISQQNAVGRFNFGDAGGETLTSEESLYFADIMDNPGFARITLDDMEYYHAKPTPLNLVYFNPEKVAESVSLSLDRMWRDVEVVTMRNNYGNDDSLFAGIHGGFNNALHQDMDAGDFVIYALGTRWITNLGPDNYNAAGYWDTTTRAQRYYCYRKSSQGQNILALNPIGELGQEQFATARISRFESSQRSSIAVVDMTEVYGSRVKQAQRGLMMDEGRSQVVIRDEISLSGKMDLWWFLHTSQSVNVTVENNGKALYMETDGKEFYAVLETNLADASFEVTTDTPIAGSGVRPSVAPVVTRRIQINCPDARGDVYIGVRFVPITYAGQLDELRDGKYRKITPIDKWTLEDGELSPVPEVEYITADGVPLEGFRKGTCNYRHKDLPYGTLTAPVVDAAVSENFDMEIIQADGPFGTANIIVSEKGNPKNVRTYTVKFKVQPLMGRPDSGEKLELFGIDASSEPQPENAIVNAIDGNPATRWSAMGYEEWITLDLGKTRMVDAVTFIFYNGTERVTYFDISVSEDGINWTKLFTGESSGETDESETYSVGGTRARYVRIDAKGTNVGSWNSFSEIEIYGR